MNQFLNFCPRCGKQNLDTNVHGSPGTAICRDCETMFAVLSAKLGKRRVTAVNVQAPPDEVPTKAKRPKE